MRKIKSYSTAFLMSLAFHALVLLLLIIISKTTINAHKIVVIDLTLMDPVTTGVGSDEKKMNDVYEPKTKHQKEVVEDVETIVEQKEQEAEEEKVETEVKIAQENENTHVDEQIPAVKTVSLVQDTRQNFVSKDQGESKRVGTLLSSSGEISGTSVKEKSSPGTNSKQIVGSGSGNNGGLIRGYLNSNLSYIKEIIQKNITYPDIARRNGWTGKVTLSFIIAYNGRVREIEVVRRSGFDCLDKNAVEAVKRSLPFPHPPLEARIIIPILYELH